ncbi:MAG: J domain-containing protein [Pseudomonadota bacterium]
MAKILFVVALCWVVWLVVRPRRKPPALLGAAEARAVLGVGADADEHEIRQAHRRLVSAVHPDKGGSADLTRRINAARDTLLRKP